MDPVAHTHFSELRTSFLISWLVWMHFLTILPQPCFLSFMTCYKYICLKKINQYIKQTQIQSKTCIDFLSSVGPIYIQSLDSCRTVLIAFYQPQFYVTLPHLNEILGKLFLFYFHKTAVLTLPSVENQTAKLISCEVLCTISNIRYIFALIAVAGHICHPAVFSMKIVPTSFINVSQHPSNPLWKSQASHDQ